MNESRPDSCRLGREWYVELPLIFALLVLALVLRVIRLDASLWEDEVLTYRGATLPLGEVFFHRTQFLYYVLAHFSLKLADTEMMLRLPSVLAGVAGVAALYGFARQAAGRTVAWLAAFILALSSFHVDKSQEARFYAFVMLANVLMVWSLWRAVTHDNWKAWLAFALAANLGVASQFTVVPYVIVLGMAGALWIWLVPITGHTVARARRILHLSLATLFGLTVLFISISVRQHVPLMVTAPSQAHAGGAGMAGGTLDAATFNDAYRLRPEEYLGFLHVYVPRYGTWIGVAFLAVLLAGIVVLSSRSPLAVYLVGVQLVLVPIPLFFLTVSHWYHERYFCGMYPYYPLAIAAGCVFLVEKSSGLLARMCRLFVTEPKQLRGIFAAILFVVFILGYAKISSTNLIHHYRVGRLHNWKGLVQYLAPRLNSGDTVAVAAPALHATQRLPKEKQVFPSSHPSLEFYLARELDALRPNHKAPFYREIQIAGAGSQRQIQSLTGEESGGDTYLVVVECREPERAPHEDLDALPTALLTRTLGLELRKLIPPANGKAFLRDRDEVSNSEQAVREPRDIDPLDIVGERPPAVVPLPIGNTRP